MLFAHPTVDGKLTKVRPQHDLAVAFITVRHASSGQIAIRITPSNNHLEWMHDVSISSPADGQVLKYNSTSGLWENGLGATTLDDLTDVTISTPSSGQALVYTGTQWANQVVSTNPMNDNKFTAIITMDIGA
jgi:hypothetical protein